MMKQILKSASLMVLCLGVLALGSVPLASVAHAQNSDQDTGEQVSDPDGYSINLEEVRPLAESGHVEAQYELGLRYGLGEGVPQNYDLALEWFGKAAEQDHPIAGVFVLGIEECRQFNGCWATNQLTTQLDIDSNT